MSTTANDARRAEWRLHNLKPTYMAALEESGGEFTPEVQALEDELVGNADDLAEAGVGLRAHARGMQELCKAEKRRIDDAARYWAKLEGLAVRWIRIAAQEKGNRFEVGTFRVSMQKPRSRVEGEVPSGQEDALVARELARFEFKLDRVAIGNELKKGAEVPGFELVTPTERTVVVK